MVSAELHIKTDRKSFTGKKHCFFLGVGGYEENGVWREPLYGKFCKYISLKPSLGGIKC